MGIIKQLSRRSANNVFVIVSARKLSEHNFRHLRNRRGERDENLRVPLIYPYASIEVGIALVEE